MNKYILIFVEGETEVEFYQNYIIPHIKSLIPCDTSCWKVINVKGIGGFKVVMVIGMILADIDLKDFWDWTVVKYTVHRLVVIPVVVYIVCSFLPLNKTVLGLCVLLAAMPAGATTSILAEKYQVDSPFATKMVIFSTLLSLPTICLWSIFLQ